MIYWIKAEFQVGNSVLTINYFKINWIFPKKYSLPKGLKRNYLRFQIRFDIRVIYLPCGIYTFNLKPLSQSNPIKILYSKLKK